MRSRLGFSLPLIAALLVAGCGGLGASDTVCPGPTLQPVTTPAAAGASVTYGFLIDRAYTGDAKRSPSYPWPQLPRTALDTVAGAPPKLDPPPGDAGFAARISPNPNHIRQDLPPGAPVPPPPAPRPPPP